MGKSKTTQELDKKVKPLKGIRTVQSPAENDYYVEFIPYTMRG